MCNTCAKHKALMRKKLAGLLAFKKHKKGSRKFKYVRRKRR